MKRGTREERGGVHGRQANMWVGRYTGMREACSQSYFLPSALYTCKVCIQGLLLPTLGHCCEIYKQEKTKSISTCVCVRVSPCVCVHLCVEDSVVGGHGCLPAVF